MSLEDIGATDGLHSPRFTGGIKPNGILDVSAEDMTIDAPELIKRNILAACNECSLMGYNNGNEFATLLDAGTGRAVKGYKLKEGTAGAVSIGDWVRGVIAESEPLSLILTHNHTNASMLSLEDINMLFEHSSLQSVMACSGDRIYAISRLDAAAAGFDEFFARWRGAAYNSGAWSDDVVDEDKLFEVFVKVLGEFGVSYERW